MTGNQRVKCKRRPANRPPGHGTWHSPHAAAHCEGRLCRWQKDGKAQRCPMMKRGN